jgi:hypothetical protein
MLVICAGWMEDIRLLRSFPGRAPPRTKAAFSVSGTLFPHLPQAGASVGDESRLAG